MTRWQELTGNSSGAAYAARMARLAATGRDMHGEATFCHAWLLQAGQPGARVLDAGCGTGRVAVRLAELGHHVVGIDADHSMLEQARVARPELDWREADLAAFALSADEPPFDLVVCAGNVIPLLAPGTLETVIQGLAATMSPAAVLITGFGLAADHLPAGCDVTALDTFDRSASDAGLVLVERFSAWDEASYETSSSYAVSIHRRV